MAEYKRFHIGDINIDDEQRAGCGRDITVAVDTLKQVNIEIGNSLIIRTDYNGLDSLRHLLHDAAVKLDHVVDKAIWAEVDAEPAKAKDKSKELTDSQTHDVFDVTGYPV